jgi:LmbE family N-acetylglucosaminyl deacetylase
MAEHATDAPIVVISPHLDDGVLSCGALLASRPGSTVYTVFAAVPPQGYDWGITAWDKACGFQVGERVVEARRREDIAACGRVGARAVHMHFLEVQYQNGAKGTHQRTHPYGAELIAWALNKVLEGHEPDVEIYAPMGLVHSDHKRVHNAALMLDGRRNVRYYEESPYRTRRGALLERLAHLERTGHMAARYMPSGYSGSSSDAEAFRKEEAVQCYGTQLRGLSRELSNFTNGETMRLDDHRAPERYWEIFAP